MIKHLVYFILGLIFGYKTCKYIDNCYMEDKFTCHK